MVFKGLITGSDGFVVLVDFWNRLKPDYDVAVCYSETLIEHGISQVTRDKITNALTKHCNDKAIVVRNLRAANPLWHSWHSSCSSKHVPTEWQNAVFLLCVIRCLYFARYPSLQVFWSPLLSHLILLCVYFNLTGLLFNSHFISTAKTVLLCLLILQCSWSSCFK